MEASNDTLKCHQCAKECPSEMNFCPACGAKLRPTLGAVGKMIEEFRKQLADTPDNADAHYNLALAYLKTGDTATAEVHLHRVTELEPAFADAYAMLGHIFFRNGEMNRAVDELAKAIQLEPDSILVKKLAEEITSSPR